MRKFAVALLLGGASSLGFSGAALAQVAQGAAENTTDDNSNPRIVVTGSRTITNGNNSPIPVTVQSFEDLQATTPQTIADGLAKLPSFQKGYDVQIYPNNTQNRSGSYLNLRGFGLERNLVLQDGRRGVATDFRGIVDANTMPSLLVERVDTVTGGVSAVYGSDAVSGVINYILDHDFVGVKGVAQAGISDYGDAFSWRAGVAFGTDLADGNIHFSASFDHQTREGIFGKRSRPAGDALICRIGAGSDADPYRMVENCKYNERSYSGLIRRVNDDMGDAIDDHPAVLTTFTQEGVLTPFIFGSPTGASSRATSIGGEGYHGSYSSLTTDQTVSQAFGRLDFNPNGVVRGFLQATFTSTLNAGFGGEPSLNNYVFSVDNPFLSDAQRAELTALGGDTFTVSRGIRDLTKGGGPRSLNHAYSLIAGINGDISDGRFNWDIYYSYGKSDRDHAQRNATNADKLSAALDAVIDPDTGQITCYITLVDPDRYPNCIPFNIFGQNTGTTSDDFDWVQETAYWYTDNDIHNVGASVAGELFNLPAGPLVAALSGEWRQISMSNVPSQNRVDPRDCTDLRFNCPGPGNPNNGIIGGTDQSVAVSSDVWEVAAEVTVPVLADVPGAQLLELNGAARHTEYSTSGGVQTWKVGGVWRPIEDITFRVTRSQDIRAPNLWELYQPPTFVNVGVNDILTGVSDSIPREAGGNPNLVPEVAQSLTAGVVFRPSFAPDLSVSVDYYKVSIDNALVSLQANTLTNEACVLSGGTSPLCDLFVRPFGYDNTSPENYPTQAFAFPLNAAFEEIEGLDVEVNYLARLSDWTNNTIPGSLALRWLLSYQPNYRFQQLPGEPIINRSNSASEAWERPGPSEKIRWTLNGSYTTGGFKLDATYRFKGELNYTNAEGEVWAGDGLGSISYIDLSASYSFGEDENFTVFGNVQNLLNRDPRIYTRYNGTLINFRLPIVAGDDPFGRYFTAGVRFNF